MLRKIGFHHRGPACENRLTESAFESESSVEQLETAIKTNPEPNATPSAGEPFNLKSRGPERAISNTNSEFPGAGYNTVPYSRGQSDDFLGLQVVYDNPDPSGDIIFVHGLGGTARKTWSWNRNASCFWPPWLAEEDELSSYRISTFGYNSNFKGAGTNLNIIDFAKGLLFQMLTFSNRVGGDHNSIGKGPILFVAHSMGGLVVKKAYVLGKHDPEYASIISQVQGIVFLATPHRGAQFAKMLNNILSTAPLGAPSKTYIAELDTHSSALQDINEQFRTACGNIALVSFFETLKTSFGVTKILIVEKESGVLGYPHETSCPLNADHHTICKFKSREDGNYISVKNVLKLWAFRIHPMHPILPMQRSVSNYDMIKKIEAILGIREPAEDELNTIRNKVMEGTCKWILQREDYLEWTDQNQSPRTLKLFWLIGLPATGKSTLTSVVIDHLQFLGENCQYHFFSSDHQAKRTAAYCLRSIARQLAVSNQGFRERLFKLHDETGLTFSSQNQNFKVIWDKVFEEIIFKMRFKKGLFWILDAVDEADSQSLLTNHLMRIQSATSIKIFLTSRPIKVPTASATYGSSILTYFLSEDDTNNDIRIYVDNAVREALPDDEQIQEDVIDQVLTKASGSFLWVKLAIDTLKENWHTQDDIRKVFTEVPSGMESLYNQMLNTIISQSSRLQLLAERILTWAACCWRPLSIAELQVVLELEPEFKGFVKLEDTIVQVCGHFIAVNHSKVFLIHATARDFLLNGREGSSPFIDSRCGHEHIATVCLRYLSNDNWRRVFKVVENSYGPGNKKSTVNRLLIAEKDYPSLGYATCYWAYHFSNSCLDSKSLLDTLRNFFTKYCLSWIEGIALSGNLRYLIRSAQYLKVYAKRRSRNIRLHTLDVQLGLKIPTEDYARSVLPWATDFVRIVGKFGPNLVQRPSAIHRLVPPFCPDGSIVGKTYSLPKENRSVNNKTLSVRGLPSDGWDDCLATVTVGEATTVSKLLATNAYLLTLISSNGLVVVCHADTFDKARELYHGEYVQLMALNRSSTLVATSGIKTYRIWDIASGKELYCLSKTRQALTMALSFGNVDYQLVIGLDDCSITCYDLQTLEEKWHFLAQSSSNEFQGCPRIMVLSPDLSKVAIAWRGKPPFVLDIASTQSLNIQKYTMSNTMDATCAPEKIQWQIDGNSILILCQNTQLVEWNLYEETLVVFDHIKPREMTISQDSNFLLTSDNVGTISVWMFPRLSLIYRLLNNNEFIRDLAFSPDAQRFYDARGSMCQAWEPDALIRADEQDLEDHSSIGESCAATEPIILHDESNQCQVTALATDSSDQYYCCGREDGSVNIHEATEGRKLRKVYNHAPSSSVLTLAWSSSDRYIVSGDDSGRIIAKRLEVKEPGKWGVFPVFDFRISETVQQFLFNESEKLLLISTASTDRIWDLRAKKELSCERWSSQQNKRWISHPLNTDLLMWIAPGEVHTYDWSTLQHSNAEDAHHVNPAFTSLIPNSSHGSHVSWVALTSPAHYIVYQTIPSTASPSSSHPHLEFISTSSLRYQYPHNLTADCASDLARQIKCLVGTFQNQIIFLDHDYWLCTWRIDTSVEDVKRQFFLPRDWLNTGTLDMAMVNRRGTFLCPKRGHVAIVRGGVQF